MAEKHAPIPSRERVTDAKGLISTAWNQFLYKIFGNIEKRLNALEEAKEDHEQRISELE